MKGLEIPGIPVNMIKGNPKILMCKKTMKLNDFEEFVSMVVSFVERKSMTISNIKDAFQEIISCLEDNAVLSMNMNTQSDDEADEINEGAGLNYYMSNEELIECMKKIRQKPLDQMCHYQKRIVQTDCDAGSKDAGDIPKIHDKNVEGKNEDEVIAEKIFDMLLYSHAPDGISVRKVEEILRKVHEMFECTTIVPIEDNDNDTHSYEQINDQADGYSIDRVVECISQKLQEAAHK